MNVDLWAASNAARTSLATAPLDMFDHHRRAEFRSLSSGAYRAKQRRADELANINSSKIMELYDLAEAGYDSRDRDRTGGGGYRELPRRFASVTRSGRGRLNDASYSDLSPTSSNYSADESTMSDQLMKKAAVAASRGRDDYNLQYQTSHQFNGGIFTGYRSSNTSQTRLKLPIIPSPDRHMSSLLGGSHDDSIQELNMKNSSRSRVDELKNGMVDRFTNSITPLSGYTKNKYEDPTNYDAGRNYRCDSALSDRLQELMFTASEEGTMKADFNANQKYIHCIKDLVDENETLRRHNSLLLNERNFLQRKLDVACHEFLGNIKMQKSKWYREREMLQTKINNLETIIANLTIGDSNRLSANTGISEDYVDDYSDPLQSIGDERGLYDDMHTRAQASL